MARQFEPLAQAMYPERQFKLMTEALGKVAAQRALELSKPSGAIRRFWIGSEDRPAVFFRIDLLEGTKIGSAFEFDVQQRESEGGRFAKGSRYRVVVNRKAR